LEDLSKNFRVEELPHYLLRNGESQSMFKLWKQLNLVSYDIVGAWKRPLFCGGIVYN
jgi:hypothetical protein